MVAMLRTIVGTLTAFLVRLSSGVRTEDLRRPGFSIASPPARKPDEGTASIRPAFERWGKWHRKALRARLPPVPEHHGQVTPPTPGKRNRKFKRDAKIPGGPGPRHST